MAEERRKTASRRIAGAVFIIIAAILIVLIVFVIRQIKDQKSTYDHITENSGDAGLLDELAGVNPEVIAWITVDDTLIDTCVTQADNNIKYVNTDAKGDESFAGNPFLDYRNSPDFSDVYSIIYGHLMEDHLMFSDLVLFQDKSFWDQKRTGTLLLTDGRKYDITFFACIVTSSDDSRFFDPLRVRNNWNEEFLQEMLKGAYIKQDEIDLKDNILALSTCLSFDTNERILILGRLSETTTENGDIYEKQ